MEYIESDVKEFIKRLPEITVSPPTAHLIMLAIRSKKIKELMGFKLSDQVVERDAISKVDMCDILERDVIRPIITTKDLLDNLDKLRLGEKPANWRGRYFSKVHNLAILQWYGTYDFKSAQKTIPRMPKEAMGILATVSPRSVYEATSDIMKETSTLAFQRDESANIALSMLNSRFFGNLHRHKANTPTITIDVDTLDKTIYNDIRDRVSMVKPLMVTETSGGYHLVFTLDDSHFAAEFHKGGGIWDKISEDYNKKGEKATVELQHDSQEPIPGTLYCRKGGEHHYVRFME